jgi:hypothetical protein
LKRPDRLKVLGQWCHVLYVDLKKEGAENSETLYGDCDAALRVIRIEKTLDDDMTKRVLKHEKMHMRLGLSGLSEILSSEQEEAICVLMESE